MTIPTLTSDTTTHWIDAAAVDDVPAGDVVAVAAGGREVALFGVDGQVYATDNLCTHGDGRLCEGFVEGHEVECPLHQGKFDVRTGQPTCSPVTDPVRCYPVRIEAGRVWLAMG